HPHTVHIKAEQTRALAREFLAYDDVLSLRLEEGAVVVQTARPDVFYTRLTDIAASGEHGTIHAVTSPDDNLQAALPYRVKSRTPNQPPRTNHRQSPVPNPRSPRRCGARRCASSTCRSGRCCGRGARSFSRCSSAVRS